MYKYYILIDDWHRPLSYLVCKVYLYDDFFVNIDNKCIANDIINLCRQRDNSFHCANIIGVLKGGGQGGLGLPPP